MSSLWCQSLDWRSVYVNRNGSVSTSACVRVGQYLSHSCTPPFTLLCHTHLHLLVPHPQCSVECVVCITQLSCWGLLSLFIVYISRVSHFVYSLFCLHSEGVGGGDNLWFQPIDPLCNNYIAPWHVNEHHFASRPCVHVAMATTNDTMATRHWSLRAHSPL